MKTILILAILTFAISVILSLSQPVNVLAAMGWFCAMLMALNILIKG